jgi:hypothetical protein
MKFIKNTLFILLAMTGTILSTDKKCKTTSTDLIERIITPQNNCINFSVGSGTGCEWMCSYCANALGTNNYYFTTDVCTYQLGGCTGNPQVGVIYTCCSA